MKGLAGMFAVMKIKKSNKKHGLHCLSNGEVSQAFFNAFMVAAVVGHYRFVEF